MRRRTIRPEKPGRTRRPGGGRPGATAAQPRYAAQQLALPDGALRLRVAVVTPVSDEPDEWVAQCLASVAGQTHPCTHVVVGDGVRSAPAEAARGVQHVSLPVRHADMGDTPRAVGAVTAIGQGADAVCFCDADNFLYPDHVERLVRLHRATGAPVCTTMRNYHALDGSYLATCLSSDGERFCDQNCILIARPAFALAGVLYLHGDPAWHALTDRMLWLEIRRRGLQRAHTGVPTVGYRATWPGMYRDVGAPVPDGLRDKDHVSRALALWRSRGLPDIDVAWRYETRPGFAGLRPPEPA
jgi:hypothetical protein